MIKLSCMLRFCWLIAIAFFSICITSCNNESDKDNITPEESYYVRFKLDGVQKEFNSLADVTLNKITSEGLYHSAVVGLEDRQMGASKNNLTFFIFYPEPAVSNVIYTDHASDEGERAHILNLVYLDEAGVSYTSLGDEFSILGVISDTKITLTEITETSVKGTFSGTLYNIDRTSTVVISEGEFWAQIY